MTEYAFTETFALVAPETTEGTSPSIVVATHAVYVEELALEVDRDVLKRSGPSPYRTGWKPAVGNQKGSFMLKTELHLVNVTGSSSVPLQTNILKAGGYKPTYSAAVTNNKKQTYGLQDRPWGSTAGTESTVTINMPLFNDNDDGGRTVKAHGCRGDYTLEMTGGERWFFTAEGMIKSGSAPIHASSRSSFGLPTYDFTLADTIVSGNGVQCQVKALTATESPDFTTGLLRSLTLKGNNNPVLDRGVCGQRVRIRPSAGTFDCVIDMQDTDVFDPLQYLGQAEDGSVQTFGADALKFVIGVSSVAGTTFNISTFVPSADCDYMLVVFTGYLTSAKMTDTGGTRTWALSGEVTYDAAAGTAGETPSGDSVRLIWGSQLTP